MRNAVIIYTHNLVPKKIFLKSMSLVFDQVKMIQGTEVVIVSQYPVLDGYEFINFPQIPERKYPKLEPLILKEPILKRSDLSVKIRNFVIGPKEFSMQTIYHQMLIAASKTDAECISIAEHDVFYPEDYFSKCFAVLAAGFPVSFWRSVKMFNSNGFFDIVHIYALSRYGLRKETLVKMYNEKLERGSNFAEPLLKNCEITMVTGENDHMFNDYAFLSGNDVLDIKHGLNTSGQVIVDKFELSHPYWGSRDQIVNMIDPEYTDVVNKNPGLGYGLLW